MIIIRKSQIKTFDEQAMRTFVAREVERVIANKTAAFTSIIGNEPLKENLRQFILDGIKKAARYDIKKEINVSAFIDILLIIGNDFELNTTWEWVKETLENNSISENARITFIGEELSEAS